MSEEKKTEAFLSRWSRLKREAESAPPAADAPVAPAPLSTPQSEPVEPAPLPPIESISVETDVTPYLRAEVDEGLKRMALKKLFQDSHFHFANMDKLDIYIDDYSIADPLPESMLKELKFAQDYLFKDPAQPAAENAEAIEIPEQTGMPIAAETVAEIPDASAPASLVESDKMSQSAMPIGGQISDKDK